MMMEPIEAAPGPRERARLLELIRELSLKRGHFVLSSGMVSDTYLDLRLTTTHPEGARLAARFLIAEAARLGANRVGGPTLGADPLVGAAAVLSEGRLRGFMVRGQAKDHGTGRQIEGHLEAGDRALLFDDVVTAGGSILRAIDAARAAGATVVGTWCLVDRGQGGRDKLRDAGAPLHPVFLVEEILASGPAAAPADAQAGSSASGEGTAAHLNRIPETPAFTVDAILELEPNRVLLIERRNAPYGWALPGGFVDRGESAEDAVRREILEETGLEITRAEQMHVYSAPGRDPRLFTAGLVFVADARGVPRAGDDARATRLFPLDALPDDICFDHRQVLEDFRAARYRIGPQGRQASAGPDTRG